MKKKWVPKPQVSAEQISQFPQIDEIVLQLLLDRGLDSQEKIDEFLNPDYLADLHDPFLFGGMEKAVARLYQAIEARELIMIYGDYDADGVSGSVILSSILKELGAVLDVYLPHRDKEGYGLNKTAVKYITDQGAKVMITVDCGISNIEEIDYANSLGIEVIVTDHHQLQETLPASINIHPRIPGEPYPFKGLAGGGVAFKLAQALVKTKLKKDPEAEAKHWGGFEKWLLDMVAISTVADLMPLLGENRTLVRYGLIVMNKGRRLGLKHLMKVAGIWPEGRAQVDLNTYNIGFQIAPRINAAGRMDHANTAYELLTSSTEEEAARLALELDKNNRDRQVLTNRIIEEAIEQIGEVRPDEVRILTAFKNDWPLGVAGLVAGRLVEKYNRPVVIMGLLNGNIVGSIRSIPAFNFIEALMELKDLFSKFGGHPMAAGFTLKRNEDLGLLVERLNEIARRQLSGKDLTPELLIDKELKLSDIDWHLAETLLQFEPFGKANPAPLFISHGLIVKGMEAVGNEGKHLRLMLGDDEGRTIKAIGFCFGHWCERLKLGDRIDLVFEVSINEWNGNRRLQLKVIDLKPS